MVAYTATGGIVKMEIVQAIASYVWFLSQWWFWVACLLIIGSGWYLFVQHSYKLTHNKVSVRSGRLGRWVDLEEHLRETHPIEWAILQEEKKKKKGS